MATRDSVCAAVIALPLAGGTLACTSSQTALITPTAPKCQIGVTSSPSSFSAAGGSATLTVTTTPDCTWTVATDSSWISINTQLNGQGAATVAFSVSANPSPSQRSGTITVGSTQLQLSQVGAPCRFTLARSSNSIGQSGGQLSVGVSTATGCAWTASTGDAWITISTGRSGNGSGTVVLSVAANPAGARVGRVNIGGETFTVTQASSPPTPGSPPRPDVITFSGKPTAITGVCPNLGFAVGGHQVVTDRSTTFNDISCEDLAKKDPSIQGEGVADAGGTVHATAIGKPGSGNGNQDE